MLIPIDLAEAELKSVVQAARPLVAIRTKSTANLWYSEYPMLVAYLEIEDYKDGKQGIKHKYQVYYMQNMVMHAGKAS